MATPYGLPSLDDVVPGLGKLNIPESAFAPPPAPVTPQNPYDLLSPEEKAHVDAQAQLLVHPRSALGEVGAGLMRGATYELPHMLGQAARSYGAEDAGQAINRFVAPMENAFAEDQNPGAHNIVTRSVASAASMLPSLAPVLLAGAAGPTAAAGAGAALFGGSTYQDTYDKAIKAGKSPTEAHQAALESGVLMGAGQAAGGAIASKVAAGAAPFARSLFNGQMPVDSALAAVRDPKFLAQFGKNLALGAAEQTSVQAGIAAGEAGIDQSHGLGTTTPWEAATASVGPTLALTGVLGAFGGAGIARQQRTNASMLSALESGSLSLPQSAKATKAIADQIAPMVGKEQAQMWRVEQLGTEGAAGGTVGGKVGERANAASQAQDQEILTKQQHENETQAAADAALAEMPKAPEVPPSQFGVTTTKPQYSGGPIDAELTWTRLLNEKDAADSDAKREELTRQLIANPPEGVMPFADYVKAQKGMRSGPLATGGKLTQEGLRQGYLAEIQKHIAGSHDEAAHAVAQEQLDLGHPNAEAPVRPTEEPREVKPLTAMEIAMRGAEEKRVAKEKDAAFEQAAGDQSAKRQTELEKIAAEGKGANPLLEKKVTDNPIYAERLDALNAHADAALAGQINGNTPVARDGFMRLWRNAASEAGIDVGVLRGQAKAKVEQAIKKAADGKKLYVQQLNDLRKARDAMKEGTVSRDSMDALVKKLENFNGTQGTSTAPAEATNRAEPQPAADQVGSAPAAAVERARAQHIADVDSRNAQALASSEQAVAATIPAKFRGEAAKPEAPAVEAKSAALPTDESELQARTRARQDADETNRVAAGAGNDEERAAQAEKAGVEPYHFENYPYRPTEARGGYGSNAQWTDSFERASRDAAGLSPNGGVLKRTEAVMRKVEYAKQALAALVETEKDGAGALAAGARRVEELRAIRAREGRVGEEMRRLAEENRRKAESEDNDLQNNPDFHTIQADAPSYSSSPGISAALTHGGNVGRVLTEIATNGKSEWSRQIAKFFNSLNLKTTIEYINDIGKTGENGQRMRLGTYDFARDAVRVFIGGDSEHTVLHETAHAATIGRINMAIAAEAAAKNGRPLSFDQRAAVASLTELRRLMDGTRGPHYAYKNEKEFVAEALSNEGFQNYLRDHPFDDRSGWGKFVDWVKNAVGFRTDGGNALERALSISMDFAQGSRFGGSKFSGEVFHELDLTNRTAHALDAKYKRMLENSDLLANMGTRSRAALYQFGSMFHIKQWISKIPELQPLTEGINKFFGTDEVKTNLIQNGRSEFGKVVSPLDTAVAGLPRAEAKAMKLKLARFTESSRLNINLNKNFDQNLKDNAKLDPALRQYVNDLHAEYKQLPAQFKEPFESSFRVNRKYYIQTMAARMAEHLGLYRGEVGEFLDPLIQKLDIMGADLNTGDNAKPSFYHDAYSQNLDRKVNEVFTQIEQAENVQNLSLKSDFGEMKDFYQQALGNPYQHLGRMGEFFLEFDLGKNPQSLARVQESLSRFDKVIGQPNLGNRHVFLRFENMAQAREARRQMEQLGEEHASDINGGSLYDSKSEQRLKTSPGFVRNAMERIEAELAAKGSSMDEATRSSINESLRRLYLDAVPDSSGQKALARRKEGGVIGFDADFVRNFAHRGEGMVSMLANSYTRRLYDDAFRNLKGHVDQLGTQSSDQQTHAMAVYRELATRYSNSLNPVESPIVDRVKAFGYHFYLAMSPAFMLVNLAQPYHLTLPELGGRYGFVKTAKEMGRSTAKAFAIVRDTLQAGALQGNEAGGVKGALIGMLDVDLQTQKAGLSAGESEFVSKLLASGQLDNTMGRQLSQLASNDPRWLTDTSKILSGGSHYTEVINRLTAGLAGYNMELARSQNHDAAMQRGVDTVKATQFDYSDHNQARALGRHGLLGKVTPLVSSFQTYSFQSMELLTRMIRDVVSRNSSPEERIVAGKQLAGVFAMTSVLAGTLGLPAANVAAALVDAVTGSKDDPSDIKTAYRGWLAGVMGNQAAEAVARGLPRALLGADISTRAGLGDVLPGTRFFTDRRALKDQLESGAFDMLGPAVSAGKDVANGLSMMFDGRIMDGLVAGLPLALRGPAKAARMVDQGYVNSTGNRIPMEASSWDTVVQSLGFTPSKKAEQSEVSFASQQRTNLLTQQKVKIANQFYRAAENGEDYQSILEKVQAFNAKNPENPINLQAGLQARAKARATADVSQTGIETLPRFLPSLQRYSYANTQ